jgi:hypothetical protein
VKKQHARRVEMIVRLRLVDDRGAGKRDEIRGRSSSFDRWRAPFCGRKARIEKKKSERSLDKSLKSSKKKRIRQRSLSFLNFFKKRAEALSSFQLELKNQASKKVKKLETKRK